MTDLFIIAAGKGSRMQANVPKALVPITDNEPCLTTTLKQIGHKFNRVFVVTNVDIQKQWDDYYDTILETASHITENLFFVPISSGLGDGHAVMNALAECERNNHQVSEDIVVVWGDVFFPHGQTIDTLLSVDLSENIAGVVPAVAKENPYVTLLVDKEMRCKSADFSKYGESHETGLHDQSVFRFKKSTLVKALIALDAALWKNGRYMTVGGELSLLYTFHYLWNVGNPVKVIQTDYPTLSFNTPQEVAAIQQEINEKWKSRFS